ncbi:MAG TPA: hypothetical protein V6C65_04140 [Allocoleopsis sp.]
MGFEYSEKLWADLYKAAIAVGLNMAQADAVVKAAKKEITLAQETAGMPLDRDRAVNETGIELFKCLLDGLAKPVEMPDLNDSSTWKWVATEKALNLPDEMFE